MANWFISLGIICISCFISTSHCWDLEELKPVSCPDGDSEEGICYSMVDQQVRCLNLTVGPCDQIMDLSADYGIRRFIGHNDVCMSAQYGYCTQYSCRRYCCGGNDVDDGECVSPYCSKECQNGGTCIWSSFGQEKIETCECTSPYYGEYCETVHCDRECEHGGTCVVDGFDTTCTCPDGFYGTTCSFLQRNIDFVPECPDWERDWDWEWHQHGHHGNHDGDCNNKCKSNRHCSDGKICCFTGRCSECVEPAVMCYHERKRYHPGDVIIEKCEACRCLENGKMECSRISCPSVSCDHGEIRVISEDKCCPECTGNSSLVNEPITFWNCHDGDTKRLPVREYTSVGLLEDLGIKATGYKDKLIKIDYSPFYVNHCQCTAVHRPKTYVTATARDEFGRSSTCGFWVVVYDNHDPVYNSCPADIFAQEGEFVQWNEPRANDYVGVRQQSCNVKNGQIFEIGTHPVTCTAIDYDNNKAFCQFTVHVYESGSDKDMPAGLQARKKKTINSAYIIAATFSAIFIVILLVFIGCFMNRRRMIQQRRQSRDQHGGDSAVHTVGDRGLYDVIGKPAEFKLPPYSPKCEPPAYDEIHSATSDMMPPTYDTAITNREGNTNIRRGFLNEFYARTGGAGGNQPTTPSQEESVYEEIRLN